MDGIEDVSIYTKEADKESVTTQLRAIADLIESSPSNAKFELEVDVNLTGFFRESKR